MSKEEKLYSLVSEAYQNATFNGYNLELMTDEELAEDMRSYDAEIEQYPRQAVLLCIKQYRHINKFNAGVV